MISNINPEFCGMMHARLAQNKHRGEFEDWSPDKFELFELILRNVHDLADAVRYNHQESVERHAADLANYAYKAASQFGRQAC